MTFNLVVLVPELTSRTQPLNDDVLHLLNLERTAEAFRLGQDPTDYWLPSIGQGYPLFHYYQHLPYLLPAALVAFSGLDPLAVLKISYYLLLSLFPISIFLSVRRFGFSRLAAGTSALVASLLSTNFLFGLDYGSYVWAGHGLYTQLWGMILLPLALAYAYRAIAVGTSYFASVVLVAATALSHLAFGYIALASLILIALLVPRRAELLRRAGRTFIVGGFSALALSYFLVPFLLEGQHFNRSVWEDGAKYDSYGATQVLDWLIRGELLDFGRLPSVTLLAAGGLLVSLWRWRDVRYRMAILFFALWLALFFGRPTWGFLLDLVPFTADFHLHRLIDGVHLGAIFLAGIGLATLLTWALRLSPPRNVVAVPAVVMLAALLVLPTSLDRLDFMRRNQAFMNQTDAAFELERPAIDGLLNTLETLPHGRVYAGLAGQWGRDYLVGSVPMHAILTSEGYDTLRLYHSLSLAGDVAAWFDESRHSHYDLFNVRYAVAPVERALPDFVRPVDQFGRHRLYEIPTTGYFDLVRSPIAFAADKTTFFAGATAWLRSPQPTAGWHPTVILGAPPADLDLPVLPIAAAESYFASVSPPPVTDPGAIVSESAGSDRYSATVRVDRDSILMLKVTFHPNWHASVDGQDSTPVMLMPGYLGVQVPPGVHDVEFHYRPSSVRYLLALISLLALSGLAWIDLRRERARLLARRLGLPHLAALVSGSSRQGLDRARAAVEGVYRWLTANARPPADENSQPRTDVEADPTADGVASSAGPPRSQDPLTVGATSPDEPPEATEPVVGERARWRFLYPTGALLAGFLAGLPLLRPQLMSGHDALAYLPRHVEFFEVLRSGVWIPRWAPHLAWGHGEPTFNFSPPLIHYMTSALHLLGLDFIAAENSALLILLLVASLGMYFLAGEFFGERGGLVAAAAYAFAPYLLSRLYVGHALADYSAFAFMPFAFWGLYRYAHEGRHAFLALGSGSVALIVLSSIPASVMTLPTLALVVALLAWWAGRRVIAFRGGWSLLLGVGLAAFFWLPSIAETTFVHIARRAERLDYQDHFVSGWQLIHSPWGFGTSQAGPDDGMSFAIGPVYLFAIAAAFVLLQRITAASRRAGQSVTIFVLIAAGAAFMTTNLSAPIWEIAAVLHPLQFPWRFLQLVALSSAFLVGSMLYVVARLNPLIVNGAMAALIGALLITGLPHARPQGYLDVTVEDSSPQNIAARGIAATAREFEPIWVEEFPLWPVLEPSLTFIGGSGGVLASEINAARQVFVVEVTEHSLVQSSTFFFPGWTLYVNGIERDVTPGTPHGLMEFFLEPGTHGVMLRFEDTPVRAWSTRLSLVALLLLALTPASVGLRLPSKWRHRLRLGWRRRHRGN